jgi:hypothetical protein
VPPAADAGNHGHASTPMGSHFVVPADAATGAAGHETFLDVLRGPASHLMVGKSLGSLEQLGQRTGPVAELLDASSFPKLPQINQRLPRFAVGRVARESCRGVLSKISQQPEELPPRRLRQPQENCRGNPGFFPPLDKSISLEPVDATVDAPSRETPDALGQLFGPQGAPPQSQDYRTCRLGANLTQDLPDRRHSEVGALYRRFFKPDSWVISFKVLNRNRKISRLNQRSEDLPCVKKF